jgi:hypothetical protein
MGREKFDLDMCRAYADDKNGVCLEDTYVDCKTPMK